MCVCVCVVCVCVLCVCVCVEINRISLDDKMLLDLKMIEQAEQL